MPTENKNFFERSSHPYYIASPAFRQSSGGIRALHYLCHALNELGYEAYIATEPGGTSPHLRTPELTQDVITRHRESGCVPIGVYPEVAHGNILDLSVVARWILNKPGHLGGEASYDDNEILFYWDNWMMVSEIKADKLQVPIIDQRVFNTKSKPEKTTGICYYANKYLKHGNKIHPFLLKNGTSLCLDIPRTPQEIAEILRSSRAFYCYEPSALFIEAQLCGCPSALVDTPYLQQFNWENDPIARINESDIESTLPPAVNLSEVIETQQHVSTQSWVQISNFVEKTQAAAQIQSEHLKTIKKLPLEANSLFPFNSPAESGTFAGNDENYQDWLRFRLARSHSTQTPSKSVGSYPVPSDTVSEGYVEPESHTPRFIILLQNIGLIDTIHLASTIDNLATLNAPWDLIVVSDLEAPAELAEIDCVHWLPIADYHLEALRHLISSLQPDWIIEAPAGTRFDESLFSALFKVDRSSTDAVFADNDYYDKNDQRHAPRFKPGVNPAALMSADLAGPLCITREVWVTLIQKPAHPAPWLSSLWQVANKHGWHRIKHLSQVLFSLPDNARHAPPSLTNVLESELANSVCPAHLQAINPACWAVLWQMPESPPSVLILIQTDGDIGLLERCLEAIATRTDYPNCRLGLLVSYQVDSDRDPDLYNWLESHHTHNLKTVHWQQGEEEPYSSFLNRALAAVDTEFVLFFADELVVLQTDWLIELVRACQPPNVVAASPRLIQPQTGHIENCGYILGLQGWRGSPYFHQARVQTPDDFDWIDASRDITTLTTTCALIRSEAIKKLGGFDELDAPAPGLNSGFGLILADFSLRCVKNAQRMVYVPRATLAGSAEHNSPKRNSLSTLTRQILADEARFNCFKARWWPEFANDPFWNRNLSLVEHQPTLETDYFADWTVTPAPANKPKILAHVLANAQADFRITDALGHLKNQGRVSTCVWVQPIDRPLRLLTASEVIRLSPDTHIVQNYVNEPAISALDDWFKIPQRPFTVLALDDVASAIDPSSPFYKNFSPDTRTRMSYALARCDRMVVSTEFLADHYRNFIKDIRVVPNRLDMGKWLHLAPRKGRGPKVRIGWAGGTTHQRDLMLLKEVIEQTRDEADWIFFGMCPPEIAPLLAESHPFVAYGDYPTFLANLELDLAVAPLADNLFNRGKSNLRLLELGILGLPVVCSDIDPYQNSPACRVKNSVAAWVSALRERIHDRDAREREGRAMRQWVLQNYLLDNHLDEWLDAHTPG